MPVHLWLYFHVPSDHFLHVSHFFIVLEAKLEEQAICKSCDIADFPSVLEITNKANIMRGVTLPNTCITYPENISIKAMRSVRCGNN